MAAVSPPWKLLRSPVPDGLADYLGLPGPALQVLVNRGLSRPDEIDAFFEGRPSSSTDPARLLGMDRALERIGLALANAEQVAVYGDYDADGVTALAVLEEALQAIGMRTLDHVPSRLTEGYGLNWPALDGLRSRGATLLLTVDCGIGNQTEVAQARRVGLDVIVTDHHTPPAVLPDAVAVLNPRQPGCGYPHKDLAGVGVAYKLAQAILRSFPIQNGRSPAQAEERLLDLVALGTVADVVPLLGENRSLVIQGLAVLSNTARIGLRQLIGVAGLRPGQITSPGIAYALAPRLNAAGRLRDARASLRLLTTEDEWEAHELALELDSANQERQRLTEEALQAAHREVEAKGELPGVLVLKGHDYHPGIIGLVAGKLVERYYRPALVLQMGEEDSRGSARSIVELDIMEALRYCGDLCLRYGGHSRAAGVTVSNVDLEAFEQRLEDFVTQRYGGVTPEAALEADCQLNGYELTPELFKALSRLAPFGSGNEEPLLWVKNLRLLEARTVGREPSTHLKLRVDDGSRRWSAVWFRHGSRLSSLKGVQHVQLLGHLRQNEWNGSTELELHIQDLWPR